MDIKIAQQEAITELVLENQKLKKERDDALKKIENQKKRIIYLEGATNHAAGTPLTAAINERNEWKNCAEKLHNSSGWSDQWPMAVAYYRQLKSKYE